MWVRLPQPRDQAVNLFVSFLDRILLPKKEKGGGGGGVGGKNEKKKKKEKKLRLNDEKPSLPQL